MRLERLTIHNLASIADATIDFLGDALRDEHIFLITGPTGAGKTTILDAICLALYNKTPRMEKVEGKSERYSVDSDNQLAISDNRQLMRRNTGECFAELIFETEGLRYKAHWYVKRAKKQPTGKLQSIEHTLLNLSTGEVTKRYADREVETITGLTYEQFCRTSILAQGEFTKFLQSNSNDKSDILEKLTGTGIYSRIGQKIYELTQEKKAALDVATARLDTVKTMTTEERLNVGNAITAKTGKFKSTERELALLTAKRDWLKKNQELEHNLQLKQQKIEKERIRQQGEAYREEQRTITDYNRSATARIWLSESLRLQAELKQASQQQHQYKAQLASLLGALHKLQSEQQKLEQQRDELKAQLQADAPLLNDLPARIRQMNDMKVALNKAVSACQLMDERKKTTMQTDRQLREYEEREKPLADTLPVLTKQFEDAARDAERWQLTYNKISLSVNDWAREMRHSLDIGDSCPVCGKTISKHLDDEHFTSVLAPIEQQKRESTQRHQQLGRQLAARQQEHKEVLKQIVHLRQQLERETQAFEAQRQVVAETCKACAIDNPVAITTDELQRKAHEVDKTVLHLFNLEQKANQLATTEQQAKSHVILLDHISKSQQNIFEIIPAWQDIAPSCDVPDGCPLGKLFSDTDNGWSQLSLDITKWHAHIIALRQQIAKRQQQLEHFFQQGDINSQRLAALAAYTQPNIDQLIRQHEQTEKNIALLEGEKNQLNSQLSAHVKVKPEFLETDTLPTLETSISELLVKQQELQQQLGALQQQLKADEQHRQQYDQLLRHREEADRDFNRWNSFCALFGDKEGKRFRSIAQSFILGHLLGIANRYLRHFSDRYTLTYNPGSLVILVSDSYHTAPPQSASILSGGESFMVSLSLALALSQFSNHRTDVDTLFIDEGFGTLDSDCLGSVMDTLERLHQMGGRRVGIISHVEELRERISTKIVVSRSGSTPSRVSIKPGK